MPDITLTEPDKCEWCGALLYYGAGPCCPVAQEAWEAEMRYNPDHDEEFDTTGYEEYDSIPRGDAVLDNWAEGAPCWPTDDAISTEFGQMDADGVEDEIE